MNLKEFAVLGIVNAIGIFALIVLAWISSALVLTAALKPKPVELPELDDVSRRLANMLAGEFGIERTPDEIYHSLLMMSGDSETACFSGQAMLNRQMNPQAFIDWMTCNVDGHPEPREFDIEGMEWL